MPVYDYALMTEPLSAEQLGLDRLAAPAGHRRLRQPVPLLPADADNRILWGGYDAIYHFGRRISGRLDHRPATFDLLARQFFETFPQLEGLRFSHQWGGAIDTCTRFFAFFGTAYAGRAAYALGYTGLGVGATRFGANVMLDLLDGRGDRADRAARWCAPSRCRSRPSRSRSPGSSSRAGRSPPPTATTVAAISGCGRLDRLGLGFRLVISRDVRITLGAISPPTSAPPWRPTSSRSTGAATRSWPTTGSRGSTAPSWSTARPSA